MSALVVDGEKQLVGYLEIFATHLVLVDDTAAVQFALPFAFMKTVQRRREVQFLSRSFAELPKLRTVVHVTTNHGTVTVTIEGTAGACFAKAIELQWRAHYGMLLEREQKMFQAYDRADVLYALALLPFDMECTLGQKVAGGSVAVIDHAVVVRVEENFTFSIIFEPKSFAEMFDLHAISMDLDDVLLLIVKSSREIRIVDHAAQVYVLNGVTDAASAIANLASIFFANAATYVLRRGRNARVQKNVCTPLTHVECGKLYEQFLAIDSDLDGSVSRDEFIRALGPIFSKDVILADALYALFENSASKSVHIFEYFHGSRVLLRGDEDDRLEFMFGMFDPLRRRQVNAQQFVAGLRTLQRVTKLSVPPGKTLESYGEDIFDDLDEAKCGLIGFDAFRAGLTSRLRVDLLLSTLGNTSGRLANTADEYITGIGHPQWQEITHIMAGLEAAAIHASNLPFNDDSFRTKLAYDTVTGAVVGRDMSAKISGFKRLTGGAPLVVFNDYAPAAFAQIRARFGVSTKEYLASLGIQQLKERLLCGALTALFEKMNSGRSGAFFYSSYDERYIIKMIPSDEASVLRQMIPTYVQHLVQNPDSLLTRFMGLHALIRGTSKVYFVVMANIFQAKLPIHDIFDLKGSTVNRSVPAPQRGVGVALKDLDFGDRRLRVGAQRASIIEQLTADSLVLTRMNLIDYSLLLGIHTSAGALPPSPPDMCPPPLHNRFQRFYGGIAAAMNTEVLYLGIIDCLTDYSPKKVGEHLTKRVISDASGVSCVPPKDYHERFVRYIESIFVE